MPEQPAPERPVQGADIMAYGFRLYRSATDIDDVAEAQQHLINEFGDVIDLYTLSPDFLPYVPIVSRKETAVYIARHKHIQSIGPLAIEGSVRDMMARRPKTVHASTGKFTVRTPQDGPAKAIVQLNFSIEPTLRADRSKAISNFQRVLGTRDTWRKLPARLAIANLTDLSVIPDIQRYTAATQLVVRLGALNMGSRQR